MNGNAVQRLDGFFHDEAGNWAVKGGSALRYDPTCSRRSDCSRGRRAGRNCWSGVPLFPKVELHRSNGVRLTVEAPETSDANQYVQSLTLNGKPRAESWLPVSFITHGGRISARMGAASLNWGTAPVDH
ncbi:glycoside hydrolase domain-containing protein [Kribbella sp. VKM Ac-2568]|uniref:glycoside hydrolase domain-containing protein n=1 Tax=Kribbella sp. VKM Ac-2568 TaxID=2512219 RepID=UPI001F5464BC|nr:glycoside hydrolase domain-containing protein [Kribbella sp. VKM Ac-2568]